MSITHVNPESLHTSPAFSHGVITGAGRTLYIGGQNGTDKNGEIHGDLPQQTEQAARNVLAVVQAAGGDLSNLVKLTIIVVDGPDLHAAYEASMRVFGGFAGVITVVRVAGLAIPGALIEIEGIAHLPEA